jgi:hypothetical protein
MRPAVAELTSGPPALLHHHLLLDPPPPQETPLAPLLITPGSW